MKSVVYVNKLPNEAFMRGQVIRDIAEIRILTPDEKKSRTPGSPDVCMKGILSGNRMISRNDLMNHCTMMNGHKLTIGAMQNGKVYSVVVPGGAGFKDVLLFKATESNSVDYAIELKQSGKSIRRKLKPNTFVLYRRGSDKEHTIPVIIDASALQKVVQITEPSLADYLKRLREAMANVERTDRLKEETKSNNIAQRVQAKRELKENTSLAPYMIVAKVVKKGSYDVIGYVVSNGKAKKPMPLKQVQQLAHQKKIRNCTLVHGATGYFLRGVGVQLDALPATYL